MSPVKQELLAAIKLASDEALAQTLLFLKNLDRHSPEKACTSSLDKFSEFLQSEGFYEDEYIDRCMTEITAK